MDECGFFFPEMRFLCHLKSVLLKVLAEELKSEPEPKFFLTLKQSKEAYIYMYLILNVKHGSKDIIILACFASHSDIDLFLIKYNWS